MSSWTDGDGRTKEAFAAYMKAKYGGMIVAPRGGWQSGDLWEAFEAGHVAAAADEYE